MVSRHKSVRDRRNITSAKPVPLCASFDENERSLLVVCAWGDVVGVAQPVPRASFAALAEEVVEQALIAAIPASTATDSLDEPLKGSLTRGHDHQPAVEAIGPSDVRCGREVFREVEEMGERL
jgi:hypothetical protein